MISLESVKNGIQAKDKNTIIVVIAGLLIVAYVLFRMFGGGISNNGPGIDGIAAGLAADQSRSEGITKGLGTIENGLIDGAKSAHELRGEINESRNTIERVIERNQANEGRFRTIDQLITSIEQRLDRVQERGKTGN